MGLRRTQIIRWVVEEAHDDLLEGGCVSERRRIHRPRSRGDRRGRRHCGGWGQMGGGGVCLPTTRRPWLRSQGSAVRRGGGRPFPARRHKRAPPPLLPSPGLPPLPLGGARHGRAGGAALVRGHRRRSGRGRRRGDRGHAAAAGARTGWLRPAAWSRANGTEGIVLTYNFWTDSEVSLKKRRAASE